MMERMNDEMDRLHFLFGPMALLSNPYGETPNDNFALWWCPSFRVRHLVGRRLF